MLIMNESDYAKTCSGKADRTKPSKAPTMIGHDRQFVNVGNDNKYAPNEQRTTQRKIAGMRKMEEMDRERESNTSEIRKKCTRSK
uniref:Retrotransposon protein n=1 Tax=Ascaris lumbricoides TaxID=6252 RepID=A0A0M3IIW4_ASCLU